MAGRNRFVRAAVSAGQSTASRLAHIGHMLFLEVTGLLFLTLALACGSDAFRDYHRFTLGEITGDRYKLATGFALLFGWFGVSSFLKAKRKGRG
jgi:hypothetical protein